MHRKIPLPRGWRRRVRSSVLGGEDGGCGGPAILDTARSHHNPHSLSRLGSPRTANQRKFSEALMHHNIPLPRGWKRRVRSVVLHVLALSDSS